jgi:cellulose synthase/poly-beta-1,6-N-acetylglucosamine synthase-like glycosyltransferase
MVVLSVWFSIAVAFFLKPRKNEYKPPAFPRVSIVIPAYNEEKNIARCINSIRNSEYPKSRIEIIVVDDGSTDNTVRICRQLGVRVLEQNHRGKVEALNRGINNSSSDLIITIDADTLVDRYSIREIVKPMNKLNIGAVSGIAKVKNKKTMLGVFQNVEYAYLQFVRETISSIVKASPGICGAFTCFRKESLKKAGGFSKKTSSEDFDIALQIKKAGYDIVLEPKATAYTVVPQTMRSLFKQRFRWTKGILQSILLHKNFMRKSPSASYVLLVHMFWFIVAMFSIPVIAYNVLYWISPESSLLGIFYYLFKWFSFAGIINMIYMIPVWGINVVYIFGIVAGILTFLLMLIALRRYREKIDARNFIGMFFYFPYTLLLNITLVGGVIYFIVKKGKGNFS